MAKYVLLYRGGGMPQNQEETDRVMAAWGDWFGKLGPAVADPGNPSTTSKTISTDGSVSAGSASISGYSIISAGSLDEAVDLAKSCPVLAGGSAIEVVETFEAM